MHVLCDIVLCTLLHRFVAVSKRDVHWVALKHRLKVLCSIVLDICPTPNPTLNLPDSVNKCKTDVKTYLLMQPCNFTFLICRFKQLRRTVIAPESNRSSSSLKYAFELTEQTYSLWKSIDTRLDMNYWILNEWMMHLYSALLCIAVHPKRFTIMWGVSPQPPPVCSIHLDDATAATGQWRQ